MVISRRRSFSGLKRNQIPRILVIKHGPFLTKGNQSNGSFELVDPKVICIPQVYHFFSDETERDYIIMGL